MTNAKQAMEDEKNRRLRVATRFEAREKQPVQVEVSDTGKGFSPEESEKLFLPFYTTKKVGQGTGLGLSVALSIVKEHGGSIDAQGNPGKGATFTVKFPLEEAESQAG
jgi:signal transduction histidine kinase